MRKLREYIHIGLFLFIIYALFVIVFLRFVAVVAVETNGSKNAFFKFIARGMNQQAIVKKEDETLWPEKYPYKEEEEVVVDPVEERNNRVKLYCSTGMYEAETVNDIATFIKSKLYKYNIEYDAMNYGSAAFVQPYIENVVGLKEFCDSQKIPFAYFSVPNKDNINYYKGKTDEIENKTIVNRNSVLLEVLADNDVDTYVLAKDFIKEKHELTYDMSDHWYARDALFATQRVVAHLNDQYGMGLNEAAVGDDMFFDLFTLYPVEKELIKSYTGADFEYLIPLESGDYQLICAEAWDYKGTVHEVFFMPSDNWVLEGAVYHNILTIANNQVFEAVNNAENVQDKKLVVIGDSFSWPMILQLNQVFKHVVFIHNETFTGSIESYIEQNEPDAVVMLYVDTHMYENLVDEAFYLK